MTGAELVAGSNLHLLSMNGSIAPMIVPHSTTPTTSSGTPRQPPFWISPTRVVRLKSMRLEGYLVMTPSDRVRKVVEDSNRIHGHLRKVHFRTAAIPRASLTKEEEKLADHAQLVTAKICDEMATARKQIAPPSPVQQ